MNRFEQALDLRRGEDPELVARVELALDQVAAEARDQGWGPYPRTSDEILGRVTPQPLEGEIVGDERQLPVERDVVARVLAGIEHVTQQSLEGMH